MPPCHARMTDSCKLHGGSTRLSCLGIQGQRQRAARCLLPIQLLLSAQCLPPWLAGDWWHPKWWRADTRHEEVVTLKNMEQVMAASDIAA